MPAASNLKVKNSTGSAYLTELTFTGVVPGTRSAAQTIRVYNDDANGEVEPATDPYLLAAARDPITDEPVLRGVRAVDERWIEIELTGVSSDDIDQPATGIQRVGRGRAVRPETIPSGGWVEANVYYNPPHGAPEGAVRFLIQGEANGPAVAVEHGHSESTRDGIIAGYGDGNHSEILVGGAMTASGTPDANINFPDLVWEHEGVPKVKLAHASLTNGNDFNGAALGSNEAYWVRVSLGAGVGPTLTKSPKFATGSADPDDVPALPTGELDGGYFLRDNTGAIDAADITSRLFAGRFEPTAASLILTLGIGRMRIDNSLVRRQARTNVTLQANQATVYVWMLPDGSPTSTTTSAKPDPRAYLLFTVPTGAASITMASLVDYRWPIGPELLPVQINLTGTLTEGLAAHAIYPSARPGYIALPRGLLFRWHSAGSGNTAGITRADLKINGTTAFSSAPGTDRRPIIEHDTAVKLSTAGLPEVLAIPPFALLTFEIDVTEAFDGTAPSGATLTVMVAQT